MITGFIPYDSHSCVTPGSVPPHAPQVFEFAPGSFAECVERVRAGTWHVDLLFNHERRHGVFASTRDGTLRVWQEDARGLFWETTPAADAPIAKLRASLGGRLPQRCSGDYIGDPDLTLCAGEIYAGVPFYLHRRAWVTEVSLVDRAATPGTWVREVGVGVGASAPPAAGSQQGYTPTVATGTGEAAYIDLLGGWVGAWRC